MESPLCFGNFVHTAIPTTNHCGLCSSCRIHLSSVCIDIMVGSPDFEMYLESDILKLLIVL